MFRTLKDIIGTKYDAFKKFAKKYQQEGIIWYFDVANFTNEDISRMMWQLKTMGYFKYCKGILLGKFQERDYTGNSFRELIEAELSCLNIPIIASCDFGHIPLVLTIVNGAKVKIYKNDNKFVMETIYK